MNPARFPRKDNVAPSIDIRGEPVGQRYVQRPVPFPLHEIRIRNAQDRDLAAISKDLDLALSVEEMRRVQDYFRAAIALDPTYKPAHENLTRSVRGGVRGELMELVLGDAGRGQG